MPQVLIIDDEEPIAWALRRAFEREHYTVAVAATAEAGLGLVRRQPPDVIFLDVRLPAMDGLTALEHIRRLAPAAAVIVITAHGDLPTAVRAVEGGAFDYLTKPFELQQALEAARRALTRLPAVPAEESGEELPQCEETATGEVLVGRSPAMQTVFKRIARVAPTAACVLITGESGTGKEVVARAIHAHSPRRHKPFLPVHVAALNPHLVESELFGHVRGAFTGAERHRDGLLRLAHGGTVFLDELADIPLPVQAKLLRVLERQEVLPVGGSEPVRVDVRIISATHADLAEEVRAGRFRHDLFYRLNVYPIHLPPLRERPEDIPLLADYFLRRLGLGDPASRLPEATRRYLQSRPWPGNVRELRNALEHAAIEARNGPILPEHFPPPLVLGQSAPLPERLQALVAQWVRLHWAADAPTPPTDLYHKLLELVEPALLAEVLRHTQGNRLLAARYLGLARATLRKLLRKYYPEQSALDSEADESL
ncbi:MAG: sigma-54 dependent transcriptional regulator [Gemmataceae bacterium]|nr:sigma-54 dependent transcriptional regulator [Gemmataceae bacterium]MDW8243689.1 sigma-54 dependent transcriptional regulator [Thermogemmata sp.]